MSQKPRPIKVFGRSHYACTRCKASKIKCLGEKPACANCKLVNKGDNCIYPKRDRKIMIMESDLNKLHAQVRHLEDLLKAQGPLPLDESLFADSVSMIQSRVNDNTLDSFYLPDTENETIPHKLLLLCAHQLPEKSYCVRLINLVCLTYSTEFYLVDNDELNGLITEVFDFFSNHDLLDAHHYLPPPISPVDLCFFFSVLAFGEQMQNATVDHMALSRAAVIPATKIPGSDFYSTASKLFHLNYEQPTISFIQSCMLLGLYACNLNRHNTVYNFFGVALRSAVANGYHRTLEPPSYASEEERQSHIRSEEKTRRIWWSIFTLDVTWAAKMNMPTHIDYTDTDVPLPADGSSVNLNDNFDLEILDCNVNLMKYVAKFNKLIYGPHVRTFYMNYINSESIDRNQLVKNILKCVDEILNEFEEPCLAPYKTRNILLLKNRNVANLIFRYDQLIMLIIIPLITLIFDETSAANIKTNEAVLRAISTGVSAAARTVLLSLKLYEYNKLFVLGFWDSQHLLSALMVLTLASLAGYNFHNHLQAFSLLRYMAENNNINAKNALKKQEIIDGFINEIPETHVKLKLDAKISDYITQKGFAYNVDVHDAYFNPFSEPANNLENPFNLSGLRINEVLLFEHFGFNLFLHKSRVKLLSIAKYIQSWNNYSGLPIHISGTARHPLKSE